MKFSTLLTVLTLTVCSSVSVFGDTFTVINTNDSGAGSLRQAIVDSNSSVDVLDTITFNIPGAGVRTISPTSALPDITDPVAIDGYTQPGASANTLAVGDNANLLIELSGASAGNVNGLTILTGNSIVRGLVINGFQRGGTINGQAIVLQGGNGNHIEGNFIGTDASGTAAVGNGGHGIDILSGNDHVIGTTLPGDRNIISGNAFTGIRINSLTGILIQGNFIGTGRDGSSPLGNGANGVGFEFVGAGSNNLVGGTVAGAGNVIANNGANGVALDEGITNTPILSNSIFANGALGIDLTHSGSIGGVTLNDAGDGDTGANNLQNFPVITGVTTTGSDVTITGFFSSSPSADYRLEFFGNDAADPSGFGEGQTFLGFTDVTTDGAGGAAFSVNFPVSGSFKAFTATATDPDGNTSEFSHAFGIKLQNISTRLNVLTGENVLIGGFIITGDDPKQVIVRAIGPSLGIVGLSGVLEDPILELHEADGTVVTNDNWKDTQQAEIEATGLQPSDDLESAIVMTLDPGAYTAIVSGKGDTTGIALVEAYDLDQALGSILANISTRGFVDVGDNAMIGGFIVGPTDTGLADILVRGIGPSLAPFGIANPLLDPLLELHDANGATLTTNDNWKDTQQTEIEATGIPPTDDNESAILQTLAPGAYTAVLRGVDDTTGVALVEVYNLPNTL
jgi:hypothetical protein